MLKWSPHPTVPSVNVKVPFRKNMKTLVLKLILYYMTYFVYLYILYMLYILSKCIDNKTTFPKTHRPFLPSYRNLHDFFHRCGGLELEESNFRKQKDTWIRSLCNTRDLPVGETTFWNLHTKIFIWYTNLHSLIYKKYKIYKYIKDMNI